MRGRGDPSAVTTDVHHPTDVNLLWDAMRCLVRGTARGPARYGPSGWRQRVCRHILVRFCFSAVGSTRRGGRRKYPVKDCPFVGDGPVKRARGALDELSRVRAHPWELAGAERSVGHALRQVDRVDRRLPKDGKIPHAERTFPISGERPRWISRGRARCPVEPGVPVCMTEDQDQSVLHHRIMWQDVDVDVVQPMVRETQALDPDLRVRSPDRRFHGPDNRAVPDGLPDVNALPRKGLLGREERERAADRDFAAARKAHPAAEPAISCLEHHGPDRMRTHVADGFERTVALSVPGASLHRPSRRLRDREPERLRLLERCRRRA